VAGRRHDLPLRSDRLASGIYFIRVTGEDFTATKRVMVVQSRPGLDKGAWARGSNRTLARSGCSSRCFVSPTTPVDNCRDYLISISIYRPAIKPSPSRLLVLDLVFVGSSRDGFRKFPDSARQETGYQLDKVQGGKHPTDFKPMKTAGSESYDIHIKGPDIRINESGDESWVFSVAKFGDTVYVLHASQKTSERHLRVGRRCYEIASKHAGE